MRLVKRTMISIRIFRILEQHDQGVTVDEHSRPGHMQHHQRRTQFYPIRARSIPEFQRYVHSGIQYDWTKPSLGRGHDHADILGDDPRITHGYEEHQVDELVHARQHLF